MRALLTGGAGFIGSAMCRRLIRQGWDVLNLDKLTYAASLAALAEVAGERQYRFVQADVCDRAALDQAFAAFQPDVVLHFAAETHVDRSITGSAPFVQTNIVGTHMLLNAALAYWDRLPGATKARFRFVHVSTDEVFGSLGPSDPPFCETTPYDPRSPYAASKAASDHLARAWGHTYGLPVIVSNCSNNFGPFQYPEKLIPLMILKALEGRPLPVYGDGRQVRDWLFVEDHVAALQRVVEAGAPGETYCIGGHNELPNLAVVEAICDLLDARVEPIGAGARRSLIRFVPDRPGHDRRYAIDGAKIQRELGWSPCESFESGLSRTVDWYLARRDWWEPIRAASYAGQRLGLRQEAQA